ncbi:MAG: sigma-70 family RNA polymerase sigma factor [Chloroflexota bacterium]
MSNTATLDQQTLIDLYDSHSPGIFRYACRLLNDSHLAEDCVSETFSRFLILVQSGKQPELVKAYLYRAAHNWVIDHYRHQPYPNLPLEAEFHSDPDANPLQQVIKRMDAQQVQAALGRLPSEQRQVIELRFVEDWSHNDVAEALGKTIEATRALQHRAINTLRQMLADGYQEGN